MNKFYLIFNVSEIYLVDFNEVFETSVETLRYSLDQTKTLIKYDSYQNPSFYESMVTKEGTYTHEEIGSIMATSAWTDLNFDPLIKY